MTKFFDVQAKQLSFRYPQHNKGITPLSFDLEPGAMLLLTGASGSGKSTLIRCLAGLIPHLYHGAMDGEVWLGDWRTVDVPMWQLSQRAGLVFQNPATQMLTLTVEEELIFGLENLGLSAQVIEERVERALNDFDLQHLRQRVPQTLSGGEQQKLALAAIMIRQPGILLLDEPLSMLDGTAALDLVDRLKRLLESGVTVVVGEHRAEFLQEMAPHRLHIDGPIANGSGINGCEDGSYPDMAAFPPAPGPLHIEALTVNFGERTVLDGVDLSIAPGEMVAVVGRNGVGKTTLLRSIVGLQSYAGRISVADQDASFGLVFQNADLALFNPTVREEILYRIDDVDWARYNTLIDLLRLRDYEEIPPLLLSEGEKKRVALATVLMRAHRDGVLLDEPSLGQDAGHKRHLAWLMRALAEAGQMVIFTTHDLALAAQAHRILLLGPHGIVADGPPQMVFRLAEAWAAIGLRIPDWFWAQLASAPTPTHEVTQTHD